MKTIFASKQHLLGHGPNQSFGNHMLHLFYVYNVSNTRKINLGIPCNSNLDTLLELDGFKKNYPNDIVCLFRESFGGGYEIFSKKENENMLNSLKIIKDDNLILPNNFYVEGWFWHEQLSPDSKIFENIKIKNTHIDFVKNKYPEIFLNDTIVLHYRGTDFRNHSIGWGNLSLPVSYYMDSIDVVSKHINIKNCVIVSDEPETILNSINHLPFNFIITNEEYYIDWLILHLSKNVICSNSSFCWTACLHNKDLTIQPKGFFMYNLDKNKTFPPNVYYKNSILV